MLKIEVDVSAITELQGKVAQQFVPALQAGIQRLSAQTRTHILEQVNNSLHSSRKKYIDALKYNQINENTYMIVLEREAWWIEDGIKEGTEMIEYLLRQANPNSKPPKTAKDGCVLNPRHKVLTNTGWKKIKDVVAGDMVLTHSGKFREVKELLVRETGVGTEYVTLYPRSIWKSSLSKENHDLTYPTLSLTLDHKVLTPSGWIEAQHLKAGDLVATPADLKRRCLTCNSPLPINCHNNKYCLNNRCARTAAYKNGKGLAALTKEQRRRNASKGGHTAKEMGYFDSETWGARDPQHLKKMRDASAAAMRQKISSGEWHPEVFLERTLSDAGIIFEREKPVKTKRVVNAGKGKTRFSTLFCDFFIPSLQVVIELDGKHWHQKDENQERDKAKDEACAELGWKVIRIPSNEIYSKAEELCKSLKLWEKNHSGELGVAWVDIIKVKRGVVNRKDHVFSKKYDICLEAEEHSFCCETVVIHNSRYRIIPFEHKRGPTSSTPTQQELTGVVRNELRKRGIPYGNLEMGPDGKPKIGKLHSFDIMDKPKKTGEGVGQGWGKIGEVKVGATGIPFLQGVNVYQTKVKGKDGSESVQRQIMTFRVVSSKMKGTGRWVHPGTPPRKFLDEAYQWALKEWSTAILPEILRTL
jgi:very-short-patch-repair endonuclease